MMDVFKMISCGSSWDNVIFGVLGWLPLFSFVSTYQIALSIVLFQYHESQVQFEGSLMISDLKHHTVSNDVRV